jgi:hypothetical protein
MRLFSLLFAMAFALLVMTSDGLGAKGASTKMQDAIERVDVVGTAFRVTLASGRTLQGRQLEGATLSLLLPGRTEPERIRLNRIVEDADDADHEILLYDIAVLDAGSGSGQTLCEPDDGKLQWAFPLKGQWNANGDRISEQGFTLTCAKGAQGKCIRFGYKPWKSLADGTPLADYHQACVHMVRADYCGNEGTTRNGMLIDYYDRHGIAKPARQEEAPDFQFEAAWNASGAICVAHVRVPANLTLTELADRCPRLKGRVGPLVCTEPGADMGKFGPVLLYNRSR